MQYATLTLSELKVLASENNAIPTGDKRSKQAWIDALEIRQREEILAAVEPTTDEEFEAALSERECLGEFSESDIWTDDTDISDAEMEAIAHTADSLAEPVGTIIDSSVPSHKKGAITVFGALMVIVIMAVQAVFTIGVAILQAAIHLKALFGTYNPDYDFVYQLRTLAQQRKTPTHFSPVT